MQGSDTSKNAATIRQYTTKSAEQRPFELLPNSQNARSVYSFSDDRSFARGPNREAGRRIRIWFVDRVFIRVAQVFVRRYER